MSETRPTKVVTSEDFQVADFVTARGGRRRNVTNFQEFVQVRSPAARRVGPLLSIRACSRGSPRFVIRRRLGCAVVATVAVAGCNRDPDTLKLDHVRSGDCVSGPQEV